MSTILPEYHYPILPIKIKLWFYSSTDQRNRWMGRWYALAALFICNRDLTTKNSEMNDITLISDHHGSSIIQGGTWRGSVGWWGQLWLIVFARTHKYYSRQTKVPIPQCGEIHIWKHYTLLIWATALTFKVPFPPHWLLKQYIFSFLQFLLSYCIMISSVGV